jgi:hypothetical protein
MRMMGEIPSILPSPIKAKDWLTFVSEIDVPEVIAYDIPLATLMVPRVVMKGFNPTLPIR